MLRLNLIPHSVIGGGVVPETPALVADEADNDTDEDTNKELFPSANEALDVNPFDDHHELDARLE